MGLQKHSDHTKLFVGHGFTGCGKTRFWCHSERSEESLFDLSPMHREILRFAQNDKRTFSGASEAVTYKQSRDTTWPLAQHFRIQYRRRTLAGEEGDRVFHGDQCHPSARFD